MCNCSHEFIYNIKPMDTDSQKIWVDRESLDHRAYLNLVIYFNPEIHGQETLETISKAICDYKF